MLAVIGMGVASLVSLTMHFVDHWDGSGPIAGVVYAASVGLLLCTAALAWIHSTMGVNWSPVITVSSKVSVVYFSNPGSCLERVSAPSPTSNTTQAAARQLL